MINYEDKIVPGQSNKERLRSVVIERANQENQTEENLTRAANDLYIAPFSTKEKIEAFFKNDKVAYKLLISELSSNNKTEDFFEIMNHISKQALFSDFINYEKKNYYDFFISKTEFNESFVLDDKTFKDLMQFISKICYDGHGKGEILLNLFFDNTVLHPYTDLYVDGKRVEIKCSFGKTNGGMLKGNKQINHPKIILETIKDCLKNDIDISILDECTTSGIKGFNNIVNILLAAEVDDKLIIDAVSTGVFSQFFEMKNFNQYMMFVNRIKFNHDTLGEQLYRLHGVCAMINYKLTCKWDYFVCLDAESGKYFIIDIPKVDDIDDISWKDYKAIYDNEEIIFRAGPSTTAKDERGYVSTIYCV